MIWQILEKNILDKQVSITYQNLDIISYRQEVDKVTKIY